MIRSRLLLLSFALVLVLAACIPVSVPGLRNIDGQTWAASFEVEVQAGITNIRLPVDLALTFEQRLHDIDAQATLEYDAGIFRLQTGRLVQLEGRLGLDDHLELRSGTNALTFDGRFVGNQLRGRVAIAGVVPVGDVTFTRVR